jgi:hypothetical protein
MPEEIVRIMDQCDGAGPPRLPDRMVMLNVTHFERGPTMTSTKNASIRRQSLCPTRLGPLLSEQGDMSVEMIG